MKGRKCLKTRLTDHGWTDFASYDIVDYYTNTGYRYFPVIWIDWEQASQYCRWAGGRIPTEAEWEKAARGGCELHGLIDSCDDPEDERVYTWGDDPLSCELLNFFDDTVACIGNTTEVGSYPLGESPYGAMDMLGNVSEWVFDFYSHTYYADGGPPWSDPIGPLPGENRINRGGNWYEIGMYVRVPERTTILEFSSSPLTGVRCAY